MGMGLEITCSECGENTVIHDDDIISQHGGENWNEDFGPGGWFELTYNCPECKKVGCISDGWP